MFLTNITVTDQEKQRQHELGILVVGFLIKDIYNYFEQLPTSSLKVSPAQPSLPIKGTLGGVQIQDDPDHLKNQHNRLPGTSLTKSNLKIK